MLGKIPQPLSRHRFHFTGACPREAHLPADLGKRQSFITQTNHLCFLGIERLTAELQAFRIHASQDVRKQISMHFNSSFWQTTHSPSSQMAFL
jgi:hypothetical protein